MAMEISLGQVWSFQPARQALKKRLKTMNKHLAENHGVLLCLRHNSHMTETIALLDFSDGHDSRGVPSLMQIAENTGQRLKKYDVRGALELPDIRDHDKFIATGGPGDPRNWGQGTKKNWGVKYKTFLDSFFTYNKNHPGKPKKLLTICHSTQVLMLLYDLAEAAPLANGEKLQGLHLQSVNTDAVKFISAYAQCFDVPLATIESRYYQMRANKEAFGPQSDFVLLSTRQDKDVTAVTAIASKDGNYLGTQFHPEAIPAEIEALLNGTDRPAVTYQDNITQAPLKEMRGNLQYLDKTHKIVTTFMTLEAA
jgi:homoserine O-succinyltransferase/O-acetyltransferase